MTTKKRRDGFSLLELVLVFALLSIIGAFSYPLYTEYLLKVRRLNAMAVLGVAAGQMEEHYVKHHAYRDATLIPELLPVYQIENYYHIAIAYSDESSYVLQATPIGNQKHDACGILTLDHLGQQNARGSIQDSAKCWL